MCCGDHFKVCILGCHGSPPHSLWARLELSSWEPPLPAQGGGLENGPERRPLLANLFPLTPGTGTQLDGGQKQHFRAEGQPSHSHPLKLLCPGGWRHANANNCISKTQTSAYTRNYQLAHLLSLSDPPPPSAARHAPPMSPSLPIANPIFNSCLVWDGGALC